MTKTVDNQLEALKQMGTRLARKCPHCGARGQLWVAHEPKWMGWLVWCYVCGFKI